ncbi:FecR domain-containing protein [Chitinasiproducens palmae]|uniref:FecR family protein n=1 Tax=Chitinasiproducens palmae TaxID=1770053 RepID=A0A1H2PV62_9BURK|nr:FecR domain-containing protein [Chitinasiproducens palmae]SDV51141.1 FecR family protein [Chitinasiproducens palmae]
MSAASPFASRQDGISARALDEALEWLVTFCSGEVTPDEREAFQSWLHAAPDHTAAWQRVTRTGNALAAVPAALGGRVLQAPDKRRAATRRQLLGWVGAAVATGAVVGFDRRRELATLSATMGATYRTATGEQRWLAFEDGTRVLLDTATALDARFDVRERRLQLHAGAIMVETGHAAAWAARPFLVETVRGTVQALGTRFSVRQREHDALVAVLDGRVEVRPRSGHGRALDAGTQARFDLSGMWPTQALDRDAQAWRDGLLVARERPLPDLLTDLARYRRGVVDCDPALATTLVSGVFPLDDTDRVLDSLARALPIRVQRTTRFWVRVTPRTA